MAVIEQFLGHRVDIPEDRRYAVKQGLWAKEMTQSISFGFTQPALVLMGGIKDLEWLVEEAQPVTAGESVIFAITGKILYLEAPVSGVIYLNPAAKKSVQTIAEDPYGDGWLFSIKPGSDITQVFEGLASPDTYLESLKQSDGFKNPEGVKGGVSGICKAVYSGIGQQRIKGSDNGA